MKIAITGGGTGGHLAIAKTVAQSLNQLGHAPIFIGSESGQDKAWFENSPLFESAFFLATRGVVNQKGLGKLASFSQIIRQSLECKKIFRRHQVGAVFSVGGFSAAPASFAAIYTRRPLLIHEQNAAMGTLNRLLSPFAHTVFSSYRDDSPVRDYPVAQSFFDLWRKREKTHTIIFLGGSQGAVAINDFAISVAPILHERGIRIIHQAGKHDIDRMRETYASMKLPADVFDFDPDLLKKIVQADFAISRAGASTLWELVAAGVPTLFVPYPYAASDHQYHNARFLVEQNLAFLARQNELSESLLLQCLESDLAAVSDGLKKALQPGAGQQIAQRLLDVL